MTENTRRCIYKYSRYTHRLYGNKIEYLEAKADIIFESDRRYRIRLLEYTNNRKPGDEMWVNKTSVKLIEPTCKLQYNTDDFWWNKL